MSAPYENLWQKQSGRWNGLQTLEDETNARMPGVARPSWGSDTSLCTDVDLDLVEIIKVQKDDGLGSK